MLDFYFSGINACRSEATRASYWIRGCSLWPACSELARQRRSLTAAGFQDAVPIKLSLPFSIPATCLESARVDVSAATSLITAGSSCSVK